MGRSDDENVPLARRRRPAKLAAKLDWCSGQRDLAVIALDRSAPGIPEITVPFGRLHDDGLAIECRGSGLPEASRDQERRIHGLMNWVRPELRLDIDVGTGTQDWVAWAGFSGAAMFAGVQLVSVVCVVDKNWGGRVLQSTPVQFLLEDWKFAEYCQSAGIVPPVDLPVSRINVSLLDMISAKLHLIDRRPQAEQILDQVNTVSDSQPVSPLIFVISGVDEDEHRLLIKRLAGEPAIKRKLGKHATEDRVIPELFWPSDRSMNVPARLRDRMVRDLWQLIGSDHFSEKEMMDPAAWRWQFDHDPVPRGFWTMLKRADAGPGHGALLRAWVDLWRRLGPGRPVMLFLCIAWDERVRAAPSTIPAFLRPRQPVIDTELEDAVEDMINSGAAQVDPMTEIPPDDVITWIERIRLLCQHPVPEQLDGLRSLLLHFVEDGKRLRPIDRHIGSLRTHFEIPHRGIQGG